MSDFLEAKEEIYHTPLRVYSVMLYTIELSTMFWIFVILTQSNKEIKQYKVVLLRLACCELMFSCSLQILFPDLLLPLPVVACRGLSGSSQGACDSMLIIVFVLGTSCFTALNDCAFLRYFFLTDDQKMLDLFFSVQGVLITIGTNLVIFTILINLVYFALYDSSAIREYAYSIGKSHLLDFYQNDTQYYLTGTDLTIIQNQIIVLLVLIGLSLFCVVNITIPVLCFKKVKENYTYISPKTRKLQLNMSYMLLIQALYPMCAMMAPGLAYGLILLFSNIFFLDFKYDSLFLIITTCTFILYPLCSTLTSLYFITPYRKFILKLLHWQVN